LSIQTDDETGARRWATRCFRDRRWHDGLVSVLPVLANLSDLHEGFAWVMVVGNGLAGIWALAAHRLESLRGRALWWFTAMVQLTIAVQVTMGVGMVAGQDIDPPQFHLFYGFVALVVVGIVYSYRQSLRPHRHLLYGYAGLFLMGLGIRAMLVAG